MDFLKQKKILVTGAAGLLGSHALLRLREFPRAYVRAVYHRQQPHVAARNIHYVRADLTSKKDCARILKDIDYVLMFAAEVDRRAISLDYLIPNIAMNVNMLQAAASAGVKKYVWLSSSTVFPEKNRPLKETDAFCGEPPLAYRAIGWTNRYIESLYRLASLAAGRQMPVIILRPPIVYGEYDNFDAGTSHVLSFLIGKAVKKQSPICIWGDGSLRRDFIYAGDVINVCLLSLQKINSFTDLNLGSGKNYTVKDVLKVVLSASGFKKAEIRFEPSKNSSRVSIVLDCRKAGRLLGKYATTGINDGINKTVSWLKDN